MSTALALRKRAPEDLLALRLIPDLAVLRETVVPPMNIRTDPPRNDHRKQWREDCERADITYYEGPLND